jgi:peptidoglycan/xylan/chitin deacetylase (PgdA/CDA1 family)
MLTYRPVNIIFLLIMLALVVANRYVHIPVWSYVFVGIVYSGIQVYGSMVVSAAFFIPIKCRGNGAGNSVALTFDDGPLPVMTERILDILKSHQAPAAFFCIGRRVEKNPDILKKISDDGHVIGNHSFLHGKFFDLQSSRKMANELQLTDRVIEETIGAKPRFFRPPYGVTNPNLAKAIRHCGHITVGWNVRSFDTMTKDEEVLFTRVTKNLQAGDIVLFHDYCESTVNVLPRVLEYIRNAGLKVVRLDELLNERAYV